MSSIRQDLQGLSPDEMRKQLKLLLARKKKRTVKSAPASFAQERLWVLEKLTPGNATYCESGAVRMTASLDAGRIERYLNIVVARHEALRTTFGTDGNKPVQRIVPELRVPVDLVDLSKLDPELREVEADRQVIAQSRNPFDLERGPLLRLTLLRLAAAEHILIVSLHHIIADGWSCTVLIRELLALSVSDGAAEASLPELTIQYADFARWQREWLSGDTLDEQLSYWRQALDGLEPLELPTDRPRPPAQTFRGDTFSLAVDERLTSAIRSWSRGESVTPFMTLLAAFQALLFRYSGSVDVCVGSPVAGRRRREVENLIGFFINMLPLRGDLSGNPTFRELVRRTRDVCFGAYQHEDIPFEKLVDELHPQRDASRTPVFQSVFALHPNVLEIGEINGVSARPVDIANGTAKYDLTLFLWEGAKDLTGCFEFNTDLFDRATIVRMAGHFHRLLQAVVADPDRRLSELPMIGEDERNELLAWSGPGRSFEDRPGLHERFAAQAARRPDDTAVLSGDERLSYRELDARANRLARHLRSLGVGPEVTVAMFVERTAEMLVGILGILKAGGAYVPIDPSYPADRITYMVEDCGAAVLLVDEALADIAPDCTATIVCPQTDRAAIAAQDDRPIDVEVSPESLAYIIYTSGSTGRPKGVQVTHGNVARLFTATDEWFGFGPDDVWTLFHSYAFDFSVWEIWGALLYGGRLVVVPYETSRSPDEFLELLARTGTTVLSQTPSAFRQLMAAEQRRGASEALALRFVVFGGEALDLGALRPWFERHGDSSPRLVNMYGITETTVHVTYRPVGLADMAGGSVIGGPIPDLRLHVLDSELNPSPIGVPGEIHVGGAGLARGYLGRPGLTAERFVPDPFGESGQRLYRSGDLARVLAGGDLEYLGRIDHQVKIRGFRIELGEIESILSEHESVRETAILVREDVPGNKRLVGYVVPSDGVPPASAELRRHLKTSLPEYMVPAAFVVMDALPLTANGKLDRKNLPAPDDSGRPELEQAYIAPSTDVERSLAKIWSEVLGVDQVGTGDNFFELGGDSILSIQVVSQARQAGLTITPQQLFQHQTIAELATAADSTDGVEAEQCAVTGDVPLTPIQRWWLEQEPAEVHHYNQSVLLDVAADLDDAVLVRAVSALLTHHDALRTRLVRERDGSWMQRVVAPDESSACEICSRVDLTGFESVDRDAELERSASAVQASLDPVSGPMMRVARYVTGDARDRLLFTIHHLAVDGVSWRILLEDLGSAYGQLASGSESVLLSPKTTSFKVWSERLVAHAGEASPQGLDAEIEHWTSTLSGDDGVLPKDRRATSNTVGESATLELELDADRTRALLQSVPSAYRTRVDEVLLTALGRTLTEWTARDSVLIELEGHGREDLFDGVDLSRTVGWFTTVYPVRLAVGDWQPGESLKRVKEQLRATPARGIGYGLLRWLRDDPELATRLSGTVETSFNYLGRFDGLLPEDGPFRLAGESAGDVRGRGNQRPHVLEVNCAVVQGRLRVAWTWGTANERSTIERLAGRYLAALTELIEHCESADAGGATPSDFPLARLEQTTLDHLVGRDRDVEDLYPLSPMQAGMLFHTLYAPDAGTYVGQLTCRILRNLEVRAFRAAWEAVVRRHAILRSAFVWRDLDRPLQVVRRNVELPWEEHDWRDLDPDRQADRLEAHLESDRARGFEPSRAPLMRVAVLRLSDDEWRLVWSHHHLLLDGWSMAALMKEVMALYEGEVQGLQVPLERPRSYGEFIGWIEGQDVAAARAFWTESLRGVTAPTPLTVDRPEQPSAPAEFPRQRIDLPPELTSSLEEFARANQLTLNTVVQGAWALLLSRYAGERDVTYGTTVSGRSAPLPGIGSMIGVLINTVPVRTQIDPSDSVAAWLRRQQDLQTRLREFEWTPLVQVQGWSEVPRGTPLFESLLIFENYPIDRALQPGGPTGSRLGAEDIRFEGQTHYPLTLLVAPGASLRIEAVYDRRRFDAEVVARTLGHLRSLMEGMIADATTRLEDVSIASEAERRALVERANETERSYPVSLCLHEMFVEQARRTPEAVAVVSEGQALSYAELERRSSRIATFLQAAGIDPGDRVGIFLDRSPEMIASVLGVSRAGGVYVPMEVNHPADRLRFILEDTTQRIVLTRSGLADRIPEAGARAVCLDTDWPEVEGLEPSGQGSPDRTLDESQAAYVIYTSGSTGQPKGVVVEHRQIRNYVLGFIDALDIPAGSSYAMAQPLSVDSSQSSVFPPLIAGGTLHLITEERALIPQAFRDYFERERIDCLKIAPSHLAALRNQDRPVSVLPRQRLIVGGEASRHDWLAELRATARCAVYNHYGPTEATVGMLTLPVTDTLGKTRSGNVPIGNPMPNARAYIVGPGMDVAPIGVPGELCIGGFVVARGYLNRPGLTADRFVPDPWSPIPGARMYRTGDRCRRLEDGSIEFLGRTDHQVKIRGFRIEPGEIQTVLTRHPKVAEAVVVPRPEPGGGMRLVAYVVAAPGTTPATDELRAFLAERLPEPLVPAAFAIIDAVPRTHHGKMDLKALPEPESSRPQLATEYAAPRDDVERRLAEIWAAVLGVERVGIFDNFFELGGHSLLATQLMSRVHDAFKVRLPLRELFDASTVSAMAQVVHGASRGPQLPPIERASRDKPLELSLAQERLWFLDQMNPSSSSYNMPAAVRLTGVLDLTALEEAFAEVARRHEILRTCFPSIEGKPVQQIEPERRLELRLVDLDASCVGDEPLAVVRRLARDEAQRPFDTATGPLLRLTLLRLAPVDHVLLVTMHHIISDGWSMGVFVREFVEAYDAFAAGHRPALPELPVQYADYAQWQRGWLTGDAMTRELGYWKRKLEHLPALELETDRPRPQVQSFRGTLLRFDLSCETSTAIRRLSNRRQATPFMTMLAAFDVVLHHRTGQVDLGVGTDVANRDGTATEALIGFFTNQIVLRTNLAGDPTFEELIARVRETALEAFAHQEVPFDKVVAALRPKRRLDRAPLVDVKLVLQNAPLPSAELGDLQVELLDPEIETSKFDLLVNVRDAGERFVGEVTYNTDLFDAERIARFLEQFSTVLDRAVECPGESLSALVARLASEERDARKIHRARRKASNVEKLRRLRRPTVDPKPSVGEN